MKKINIIREFSSPLETVFQAWSKAGHLQQWWSHEGVETIVKSFVFKPGGVFHYAFILPDNSKIWGKFHYKEIEAPNRIIFTNSFSDDKGCTLTAPENIFGLNWPLKVAHNLTLSQNNQGATRLELEVYTEEATPEEQESFEKNLENIQRVFENFFDRLEHFLVTQ